MNTHRMLYLLCVPAVVSFLLFETASAVEYTPDSLETVRKNLAERKAVLLDVREAGEWKQGHLANAMLLPLSELRKAATDQQVRERIRESLPGDKIIYCHCASGVRVITATQLLGKQGYKIRPLEAGYKELLNAGFPRAAQP